MAGSNVVVVRDPSGSPPDWDYMRDHNLTPALPANDPNVQQFAEEAAQHGVHVAVWMPAGAYTNPQDYARTLAAVAQQTGATEVIANVEQQGEGAAGAQWSRDMMAEYSRYFPPGQGGPQFTVDVEYNKTGDVWDYSAYQQYGASVSGQAFTGNSGTPADADHEYQVLKAAGWTDAQISVALRPGQSPGNVPNARAYTWDDSVNNRSWLESVVAHNSGTAGTSPAATGPDGQPTQPQPNTVPPVTPSRRPDAQDPRAVHYSQQRLNQMRRMGYRAEDYGLQGLDPTAQWRAMSAIVGARQAIAQGHGSDYVIPPGTPPEVAAQIQQLIAASTAGADTGQGGDVRPGQPAPGTQPGTPPGPAPPGGDPMTSLGTPPASVGQLPSPGDMLAAQARDKLAALFNPPGMQPGGPRPGMFTDLRAGMQPDSLTDLLVAAARARAAAQAQGTTPGPTPLQPMPDPQQPMPTSVHPDMPYPGGGGIMDLPQNPSPGPGGLPPLSIPQDAPSPPLPVQTGTQWWKYL